MILITFVYEKRYLIRNRVLKTDKKIDYLFQRDDCGHKQKLLQSRSLE